MNSNLDLSVLRRRLLTHRAENDIDSWRDICDWLYWSYEKLIGMFQRLDAAEKVIESLEKEFYPPANRLRVALEKYEQVLKFQKENNK